MLPLGAFTIIDEGLNLIYIFPNTETEHEYIYINCIAGAYCAYSSIMFKIEFRELDFYIFVTGQAGLYTEVSKWVLVG